MPHGADGKSIQRLDEEEEEEEEEEKEEEDKERAMLIYLYNGINDSTRVFSPLSRVGNN